MKYGNPAPFRSTLKQDSLDFVLKGDAGEWLIRMETQDIPLAYRGDCRRTAYIHAAWLVWDGFPKQFEKILTPTEL